MQTIEVDGARVGYVETGAGEPPLVFVHGWSCDHTFFTPQADRFATQHRCVSVDLRGHHGVDAPAASATIPTHAADVIALCDKLDIERPVIVGHSMGGVVALEIAAQAPKLPTALALVDPALVRSEAAAQLEGLAAALASSDHRAVARDFIESRLFMATDDEAVRAQVTDAMLQTPQDVMVSEMRSIASWRATRESHVWALPVIAILSGQTVADPVSLGERCADLDVVHTPEVGHFNQLLAADAVNEAIEQLLARVLGQ